MANLRGYIIKELIDFDDERNPTVSLYDIVWPITVLDAVIDQNTPNQITLREILNRIHQRLDQGPDNLKIDFPVRSVRTYKDIISEIKPQFLGDVILTKEMLGLDDLESTLDTKIRNLENGINGKLKELYNDVSGAERGKINKDLDAKLNTTTFNTHVSNYNSHINAVNPHGMSIKDLVTHLDGTTTNSYIQKLIDTGVTTHNNSSSNAHTDIRSDLADLELLFGKNNDILVKHVEGDVIVGNSRNPHAALFKAKEDISRRSEFITSADVNPNGELNPAADHDHYPTNLAVIKYVDRMITRRAAVDANDIIGLGEIIENIINVHNISEDSHDYILSELTRLTMINENDFERIGGYGISLKSDSAYIRSLGFELEGGAPYQQSLPYSLNYSLFSNGTTTAKTIAKFGRGAFLPMDDLADAILQTGRLNVLKCSRKRITRDELFSTPIANLDEDTIYMVPKTVDSTAENFYEEWMVFDGKLEQIGDTKVNLLPYLTIAEAANLYYTKSVSDGKYLTITDANTRFDKYLEKSIIESTYLTSNAASSTYLTRTDSNLLLPKTEAASTYLTINNAKSTYLSKTEYDDNAMTTNDIKGIFTKLNFTIPV